MRTILGLLVIVLAFFQPAFAESPMQSKPTDTHAVVSASTDTGKEKKSVEDVIPLTMANMRGHKMLYDEGWFVITSSKKALAFAREHSISSSRVALSQALSEMKKDTKKYASSVKEDTAKTASTGMDLMSRGTKVTGDILLGTHELAGKELAYAGRTFDRAMDKFITGTIGIGRRTERDRRQLASVPGDYYRNLKDDFSNIYDLTDKAREKFGGKIDAGWDRAFKRASTKFRAEYEKSGESGNTLEALGPVLVGWLKAFYHGIAAPTSKTVVKTTTTGVTYGVFLPMAATSVVAGRTVQSVGLTVYYTGESVVKIISPTVEGGLLASMSILSTAAVPVTYAGGAAVGAVNQVAFTAAGPAYAAGVGTGTAAIETAGYVAFVTYDAAAGMTKVLINQAASGMVLGYNALTAIPAQTLMAAGDAAVFLAWDGPRLVIAEARGEVGPKDAKAKVSGLPVGTVVDLKKLKDAGAQVDVLTTDEKTIKEVLEKIQDDLRETDHETNTTN
jgi:hypothetical protein